VFDGFSLNTRLLRLSVITAPIFSTAFCDRTFVGPILSSAGFGRLRVDDLFKAAIFKIDSKFMREMKASGFADLGMEELVKARF
jgi:hypothetical protein